MQFTKQVDCDRVQGVSVTLLTCPEKKHITCNLVFTGRLVFFFHSSKFQSACFKRFLDGAFETHESWFVASKGGFDVCYLQTRSRYSRDLTVVGDHIYHKTSFLQGWYTSPLSIPYPPTPYKESGTYSTDGSAEESQDYTRSNPLNCVPYG